MYIDSQSLKGEIKKLNNLKLCVALCIPVW